MTLDDLQHQWEKQKGICPITGMKLVVLATNPLNKKKLGRYLNTTPVASLDRIDNMQGYVKGNVIWVHKAINMMRNAFDIEYFKRMCRIVADYETQAGSLSGLYGRRIR